jgi:hypothetical protein
MDVVAAFEEVRGYLGRFNALDFLSQFSMTYLFTREGQFVSESDYVHIRSRELEFASGFYATQPLKSDGEQVDGFKLEEFRKLSDAYFTAVDASFLSDTVNGKRMLSSPMVSARIHSLHVRVKRWWGLFAGLSNGVLKEMKQSLRAWGATSLLGECRSLPLRRCCPKKKDSIEQRHLADSRSTRNEWTNGRRSVGE